MTAPMHPIAAATEAQNVGLKEAQTGLYSYSTSIKSWSGVK